MPALSRARQRAGRFVAALANRLVNRFAAVVASLLAVLVTVAWAKGLAIAAGNRPNIVWLVQDHVPWRHYTAAGGPKPNLETLNRLLAGGGVLFEEARTVLPICAPARSSMLTGVYPHNHGLTANDSVIRERSAWYPDFRPFNHFLAEAGYDAAYFGKWHAGTVTAAQLGFEGYAPVGYGDPYATAEYREYLRRYNLPDPVVVVEWHAPGAAAAGTTYPVSNGALAGRLLTPVETHESYFVASLASEWIQARVDRGDEDPFVLRVDLWGPHHPYFVAEPFAGTIDPKAIPEYPSFGHTFEDRPQYHKERRNAYRRWGMTRWEDWQPIVQRAYENFAQTDSAFLKILDTLERNGLSENTIIIYTADHGDIVASGGGLFDKDAFMTEEVMSIPLVVYWPGVTNGGRSDALVSNLDLVPTVLEMAGVPVPEYMDGRSLVPLVTDPEGAPRREHYMAEHFGHKETHVFQRALYFDGYKYVAHLGDRDELYDLRSDPFELHNRIDDPALANVMVEMKNRLLAEMDRTGDRSRDADRLREQIRGELPDLIGVLDTAEGLPEIRRVAIRFNGVKVYEGDEWPRVLLPAPDLVRGGTNEIAVSMVDARGTLVERTIRFVGEPLRIKNPAGYGVRIGGVYPVDVSVGIPPEDLASVDVRLVLIAGGERAATHSLFAGRESPGVLPVDTSRFDDGAYDLVAVVRTKAGDVYEESVRVVIENWIELDDAVLSPQSAGWFGTVERMKTKERTAGWEFVGSAREPLFGDADRIRRSGDTTESLTWALAGVRAFDFTVYARSSKVESTIEVSASADGRTWAPVPYDVTPVGATQEGWVQLRVSGIVPQGFAAQMIRFTLKAGGLGAEEIELGHAVLKAPHS